MVGAMRSLIAGARAGTVLLVAVAILVCLSVFSMNRSPLYYYDTGGYLSQGNSILSAVGLPTMDAKPSARAPDMGNSQTPAPTSAVAAQTADTVVVGSRSAIYGLVFALFYRMSGPNGIVFLNIGVILSAVLLMTRCITREYPLAPSPLRLTALGLIAACFGSLPFYIAFLMPDIFAPVLVITLASLCVYAPTMRAWEISLTLALALFALLTHPSHLLMAGLLLPAGLMLSPALVGRRLWIAVGLVTLLIGVGVGERVFFGMAVERLQKKQVMYLPFLTARLIDDGPGLVYLQTRCPDPNFATCTLFAALYRSDDPGRLDAPNILFSRSEKVGSLKLLSEDDQRRIASEQFAFAAVVAKADPLGLTWSFIENVATQLGYFSISMTVPTPDLFSSASALSEDLPTSPTQGPLVTSERSWIGPLTWFHGALYLAAFGVILALMTRRAALRSNTRMLTILILLGILINAMVCAGVSEPAHRYGARVMFLLPMLAAILFFATRVPTKVASSAALPRAP